MTTPGRVVNDLFQLPEAPVLPLRFNIAPSQPIAAVRITDTSGQRELVSLRWGLIPSWSKDAKGMINARAETAASKPTFRSPFRHRRCLILADGFYEWQKTGSSKKQPFYFRLQEGRPFAFAGLWDRWHPPEGEVIETATILTTEANDLVRPVHERMPVILPTSAYKLWLDPAVQKPEALQPLLQPYPSEEMIAFAVSLWVNDPKNDDAKCVQPL